MSNPRYDWWSYVKGMIYRYPALCDQHSQAMAQKITPSYAAQPSSSESSRTTEDLVARAMSRTNIREFDAVRLAIQQTDGTQGGDNRLQLIKLIYWKRTHTLSGAALELHISYRTARRWNGEFIRLVAGNFGLLD